MSSTLAITDGGLAMSDAFPAMSEPVGRTVNRTMSVVKFLVLVVSVAAAVPTAHNLYYSYKHNVPFNEVSHRLEQYELWMKNLDCKVDYRALSTAGGTRVDVGSCPKTGDIAIKVSGKDGKATYEWIAYNQLQKPGAQTAGLLNLIVTPAFAATPPDDAAPQSRQVDSNGNGVRIAQGAGMEVLCQAQVKDQIIRVVRDNGKCFREALSPIKGSIDSRTEVPCDAQCK